MGEPTYQDVVFFIENSSDASQLSSLNSQLVSRIRFLRGKQNAQVKNTLQIGEIVTFASRRGHMSGTVRKFNRSTATVLVSRANGQKLPIPQTWRVAYTFLKKTTATEALA